MFLVRIMITFADCKVKEDEIALEIKHVIKHVEDTNTECGRKNKLFELHMEYKSGDVFDIVGKSNVEKVSHV